MKLLRSSKSSFIIISAVIFMLDLFFVAINYYSSKVTLDNALTKAAIEQRFEFKMTLDMTYRNMMQMALFISENKDLNQIFLRGKKAVMQEGGGRGGQRAHKARLTLLRKIKPAWDKMSKTFDIRQLHYHLGPGSLSFLRVHQPHKYGDRMDDLRHIIVDTNEEKTPRFGFETGRIYSGLRGVYPIWAKDPETKQTIYVGAVETGTSFRQILPKFFENYNTNVAVLLSSEYVKNKMWPEFINKYFRDNPNRKYYIEATSSPLVKLLLDRVIISKNFKTTRAQLVKIGNNFVSAYYFPLQDYKSSMQKNGVPGGFVLVWEEVTGLIASFYKNLYMNIIFAIFAFIIVEIVLIAIFLREKRLQKAEKEAVYDELTGLYNRRHFNSIYDLAIQKAKKDSSNCAVLLCDIDFFKRFNDHYGHQAGDDCLYKVAKALKNSIRRTSDYVCRYGGEEFAIILPDTSLETAARIAQSLCDGVLRLKIPHEESSVSNYVTLSVGVACTASMDYFDHYSLLKHADDNLYRAKMNGRNQFAATEPKDAAG